MAKKDKPAPAGEGKISVTTRQAGGRRRAGVTFGEDATILDLEEISDAQLAEIEGDPLLIVKRVAEAPAK